MILDRNVFKIFYSHRQLFDDILWTLNTEYVIETMTIIGFHSSIESMLHSNVIHLIIINVFEINPDTFSFYAYLDIQRETIQIKETMPRLEASAYGGFRIRTYWEWNGRNSGKRIMWTRIIIIIILIFSMSVNNMVFVFPLLKRWKTLWINNDSNKRAENK